MRVSEWMSGDVVTIGRNETIEKAMTLMRKHGYRHLPVMDGKKLVGILATSDVRRAMPSQVSTLGTHEATYLFDKVKVKEALPEHQKLITINAEDYIEEAALLMRAYKISALPVVNDCGDLVGIVTSNTIFEAFVELLGVRSAGSRIEVELPAKPGQLAGFTEIISEQKLEITRIASFYDKERNVYRSVVRLDVAEIDPIIEILRLNGYKVISYKGYQDVNAKC